LTVKWEEITKDHIDYLDDALTLYDHSFPLEVREPHNVFLKSLEYAGTRTPNTFRFLIGMEDHQLVSLATGHYFANINAGFIVYLVANPDMRGKGIGQQTIMRLEKLLNQDAIVAGKTSIDSIFLETEMQELAHSEMEKEDCFKRERFFNKNGYKKISEIEYLQPPLHSGGSEVPLNLFAKSFNQAGVGKNDVKAAVQTIYKEKYSHVNGIDNGVLEKCLYKMFSGTF
jgi:GNAT superfamily N-acetyltransferase